MTGNNNNQWKTSVSEFRGFVKEKLNGIDKKLEQHCSENKQDITAIKNDIQTLKTYVAVQEAVKRVKNGFWGFIGGIIPGAAFLLAKVIFKL